MKKVKLTRSSGNVFRDLGFSGDEAEAAELLGVTQPRVSDLMRGRIGLFSIDTLIDMLARLGVRTRLVLQPRRRRAGVA
jgi:transcriptional regulator with XRE-family HTH domain